MLKRYLKETLLFALTVALPSGALLLLSLRLISQEKELAEKRSIERREELGRQFGGVLLRELRTIAERGPEQDEVVVIAVAEDRLVLPWEKHSGTAAADVLAEPPYSDYLSSGQRLEFSEGQFNQALGSYREAASHGRVPAQRAHAQLAVARVLGKIGSENAAREQLWEILNTPLSTKDEWNVPLSLYAAGQLLNTTDRAEALFALLATANEAAAAHSTAALYMLREYLTKLLNANTGMKPRIEEQLSALKVVLARREKAEILRDHLNGLRSELLEITGPRERKTRWLMVNGAGMWFVGAQDDDRAQPEIVAVNAEHASARALANGGFSVFEGIAPRIALGSQRSGVGLGDEFPDQQIVVAPGVFAALAVRPQWGVYFSLIVLVVGVTLYSSYLWWRDTRRELDLARMRSDFVSSVSHELKTPLTSVQMLAETIRTRDLGAKERNEYLDFILSESQRLGRLLKNVLDFSQIEQGTRVYHQRPTELTGVIEASIGAVRQALNEKKLRLELKNSAPNLVLNLDADALEQALLNLLHNAIKYSSTGAKIEVFVESTGSEAAIEVRDHGVGIHPRDHERIFERFYRASEEHNRRIPGTGLGLALVKHIIEGHAGRTRVESSLGNGSAFTIYLPLTREG